MGKRTFHLWCFPQCHLLFFSFFFFVNAVCMYQWFPNRFFTAPPLVDRTVVLPHLGTYENFLVLVSLDILFTTNNPIVLSMYPVFISSTAVPLTGSFVWCSRFMSGVWASLFRKTCQIKNWVKSSTSLSLASPVGTWTSALLMDGNNVYILLFKLSHHTEPPLRFSLHFDK